MIGGAFLRSAFRTEWSHAALAAAAGAVMIESGMRLLKTAPTMPMVHLLLLVVGISSIMLSWRWLIPTIATALGVWSLAAWLVFTRPNIPRRWF